MDINNVLFLKIKTYHNVSKLKLTFYFVKVKPYLYSTNKSRAKKSCLFYFNKIIKLKAI